MPTATAFAWTFPWAEMVGAFNAFVTMLSTPVALAIGLILAFMVAGFVVSLIRRARAGRG
jgi:hypothetical protein